MVNIEEAKYSWNVVDGMTLTFGSPEEPYGLIVWGIDRQQNTVCINSKKPFSYKWYRCWIEQMGC